MQKPNLSNDSVNENFNSKIQIPNDVINAKESPQLVQLKNNLHFLQTESDEKNKSNFNFTFSPNQDNQNVVKKQKKLQFQFSSGGSIVKNLSSSARKQQIHSSVKKAQNSAENKSPNEIQPQTQAKRLILSSYLVPGNILDLSCLTDTFQRENLALDVKEPNFNCPKFIKSLAINMVASINDDMQKKKVQLEKNQNKKLIENQNKKINKQYYDTMTEQSYNAMNNQKEIKQDLEGSGLKVERERMNLNFGCNQHEQYDN